MTIEECIDILDDNFTVLNTHGHYTEKEEAKAIEMAIASLGAWKKVRQGIEDLEKSYGFDKATKYGNKDEKQMDLSYSTMYMYEIAGMVDEIKEIIDEHLQEVTE